MSNLLPFARPYQTLLFWLVLATALRAASVGAADTALAPPAATARTPHVEISLVAEDAVALFAAARQRWPAAAPPADWELRAEAEAGGVALHLRAPGNPPSGLQFFPFAPLAGGS